MRVVDYQAYYHPITSAYDDGEEDEDGNIIYTDSDELYDFDRNILIQSIMRLMAF